jgi:hypothetical protein
VPNINPAVRILVKAEGGQRSAHFALNGGAVRFKVEPLFASIGPRVSQAGASVSEWQIWTPLFPISHMNVWDLCHQVVNQNTGTGGTPRVEFAEPDYQQRWIYGEDKALAATTGSCGAQLGEDPGFPVDADPLWFKNARHAQFDDALSQITSPGVVRVAHLDTGYDPNHATVPLHIRKDLERNFVDAGRLHDASDDSQGPFNSLGHGTGTLGILAGQPMPDGLAIGCSPFVEVAPIRVADRVVLFFNSAIATALDYVHSLYADSTTRIHVVTMSMGGLACRAWADAINALYEAGVFVVTAAGNNFDNLPTKEVVFPARFNRVVAACGVMADGAAYADLGAGKMAGNYGPREKMSTAIAAWTPNIPWARLGCPDIVDLNGAGTSCATPQIAAAAAMWIQQNKAAWEAYPEGWMRVEAVRQALFDSAVQAPDGSTTIDHTHLGNGVLHARAALSQPPANASALARQPEDAIFFPLADGPLAAAPPVHAEMLALEALQLTQSPAAAPAQSARSGRASQTIPAVRPKSAPPRTAHALRAALLAHPNASQALREALSVGAASSGAARAAPVKRSGESSGKGSGKRSGAKHAGNNARKSSYTGSQ